jgi:hypothetical protein
VDPELFAGIDRLLVRAAREVRVLATLTPLDARRERARLARELCSGTPTRPRWSYAPVCHDALRRALDQAEAELARGLSQDPLGSLYLGRIRELSLEAAICEAAGSPALGPLARRRYEPGNADEGLAASHLSSTWIAEAPATPEGSPLRSDSPHPSSLLSRMQAAVGAHRLPFAVVAAPSLAPLAATGEGAVLVAAGRMVHEEDAIRTVLHEIEGHARPRARAMGAKIALFRTGTGRGIDDQEGRALLLEQRAGLLTARRRRQLAARYKAVEGMLDGGTFSDVAFSLVRSHGLEPEEAVVVSERAFRGGDGVSAGLGRERVYIESFVRVCNHLAAHPEDEDVLAEGQIAVDAASALRGWCRREVEPGAEERRAGSSSAM